MFLRTDLAVLRVLIMEDEKQMEMSEEVKKKIMDIAKRLYDLQEESKNSNSDSDDSEHIVERLKQTSLNLLKVGKQSSFIRCLSVGHLYYIDAT